MMTSTRRATALGLALFIGCGANHRAVRPDEMSAAAHRQEARRESEAARGDLQEFKSSSSQRSTVHVGRATPEGGVFFDSDDYDPRNDYLLRAQQLRRHAQQHEAAARALESFEEEECKEFSPAIRAACPLLGPVVEIVDIPGGIRARFAETVRVDAVVAHMRCHLAYARTRGFDTALLGCPLYVRGTELRRASDPRAVEIVGRDATVANEIRSRAREEALVIRAGAK